MAEIKEIIHAEIRIVFEDVERIESRFAEASKKHALVTAKITKLDELRTGFVADQATAATEVDTLKRMLTARRRTLFELEQEV